MSTTEETLKALKSKLPGKLQALYIRPGFEVELGEFDNAYEAGVWAWGRFSDRMTFFYRGQTLPPTPSDVDATIQILEEEIRRIDHDVTT
jgi:hypothetical protein